MNANRGRVASPNSTDHHEVSGDEPFMETNC